MKTLLMVIFVMVYVLSFLSAFVERKSAIGGLLMAIAMLTSFVGMLLVAYGEKLL